jgi:predicted acyltransferase
VNAIFVFVASGFVGRALGLLKVGPEGAEVSVHEWIYANLFTGPFAAVGVADQRVASLAYALAYVGLWWLVLWGMWRRGWSIRV